MIYYDIKWLLWGTITPLIMLRNRQLHQPVCQKTEPIGVSINVVSYNKVTSYPEATSSRSAALLWCSPGFCFPFKASNINVSQDTWINNNNAARPQLLRVYTVWKYVFTCQRVWVSFLFWKKKRKKDCHIGQLDFYIIMWILFHGTRDVLYPLHMLYLAPGTVKS